MRDVRDNRIYTAKDYKDHGTLTVQIQSTANANILHRQQNSIVSDSFVCLFCRLYPLVSLLAHILIVVAKAVSTQFHKVITESKFEFCPKCCLHVRVIETWLHVYAIYIGKGIKSRKALWITTEQPFLGKETICGKTTFIKIWKGTNIQSSRPPKISSI